MFQFLEYFFTEEDAKFFVSLGLNCIRIAVVRKSNLRSFATRSDTSRRRRITVI